MFKNEQKALRPEKTPQKRQGRKTSGGSRFSPQEETSPPSASRGIKMVLDAANGSFQLRVQEFLRAEWLVDGCELQRQRALSRRKTSGNLKKPNKNTKRKPQTPKNKENPPNRNNTLGENKTKTTKNLGENKTNNQKP